MNSAIAGRHVPDVQAFVAEWELDWQTGGNDEMLFFSLCQGCQFDPDTALCVLVALAGQSRGDTELVAIAEGLEWFMMYHGAAYWDVLNSLCRTVPRFRAVMARVWGTGLPKDLRRKVEMWQC